MIKNRSRAAYIFSMVIFGTISIFKRGIALSSGEISLLRAVIGGSGILLYMLLRGEKLPFRQVKSQLPLLLLSGAMMGANWIFFFEAMNHTTVAVATLGYYFAPIIVMVLSPLLFREKFTAKQVLCFVMASAGLVLIIGTGGGDGSSSYAMGIGFALAAAALYAGVILLNKRITSVSGMNRTVFQFISAIAVLIPYVAMTSGFQVHTLSGSGIFCMLVLGLVHTGFAYCLYFSSLSTLQGQQAAILSYTDPLVSVIVSVTILGESLTLTQAIGGALILGFSLLNELELPKKSRTHAKK